MINAHKRTHTYTHRNAFWRAEVSRYVGDGFVLQELRRFCCSVLTTPVWVSGHGVYACRCHLVDAISTVGAPRRARAMWVEKRRKCWCGEFCKGVSRRCSSRSANIYSTSCYFRSYRMQLWLTNHFKGFTARRQWSELSRHVLLFSTLNCRWTCINWISRSRQ